MADLNTYAHNNAVSTTLGGFSNPFAKIGNFFSSFGKMVLQATQVQVSARIEKMEALNAKTDAELAEMGIQREAIAYHVFKDLQHC
ncbi:hypothetical protein [Sulfitobacter donghicola]|uniref:DUF1127 domain-containing protein n=1 Tax=Sulfitobacter donghicola DSW-25 = KCTC 12864 = JCM 14565 TaxID=1300350 RepID=A0A073IKG7_9RHOB|nr:hypothetical protein [Sulfitobacter donghicola]KEJ90025.1 hypothetical protein DSW25_07375 [Sulfitobacter donghicola DSW-25 = KCTC 12864 = JCM 14565]KIN66843.1 hypothetical protein Z948_547 [Sulfitobacter donghicola DSW-25 = KCTC 12864 = JCM 14565]